MNLAQFRPEIGPVIAEVLKARLRQHSEGPTPIRRYAPLAPVENRLRRLSDQTGERREASSSLDRRVELVRGQHAPILNGKLSNSQQAEREYSSSCVHNACVNDAWKRVDHALTERGKGLQWLADRMECSVQRVHNWKSRGIPRSAYPEVAAALKESIDWVAGRAGPKKEQRTFTPEALALAALYDDSRPEEQRMLRRLLPDAKPEPEESQPMPLQHKRHR